jgi:hypothetical protein
MTLPRPSSPELCPGQIRWNYDRTEIIADGLVHAIGLSLGLVGAIAIVTIAITIEHLEIAPVVI